MKNKKTIGTGLVLASLLTCFGCAHKKPVAERPMDADTVSGTTSAPASAPAPMPVAANPNLGASSSGRSR